MEKSRSITLSDGKEITIYLLPLRAYGDLMVSLQGVFKEAVGSFDGASNDAIMEMLPVFIQNHMDEAGNIIALGTRGQDGSPQVSKSEALDQRGLADAVDIITTVIEINDIERIVNSIKKATAVFRKRKAQTSQAMLQATQPAAQ